MEDAGTRSYQNRVGAIAVGGDQIGLGVSVEVGGGNAHRKQPGVVDGRSGEAGSIVDQHGNCTVGKVSNRQIGLSVAAQIDRCGKGRLNSHGVVDRITESAVSIAYQHRY